MKKLLLILILCSITQILFSQESITNNYTNLFELDNQIYCFGTRNSVEVVRNGKLVHKHIEISSEVIKWGQYGEKFINIDVDFKLNVYNRALNLINSLQLPDSLVDIRVSGEEIIILSYPNLILKYNSDNNSISELYKTDEDTLINLVDIRENTLSFITKKSEFINLNRSDNRIERFDFFCLRCDNFKSTSDKDNVYIYSLNSVFKYNYSENQLKRIKSPSNTNIVILQDNKAYSIREELDSIRIVELDFVEGNNKKINSFLTNDKLINVNFSSYIISNGRIYLVGNKSNIISITNDFEEIDFIRNINSSTDRVIVSAISDDFLVLSSRIRLTYSTTNGGINWQGYSKRIDDYNGFGYRFENGYIIPFSDTCIFEYYPSENTFYQYDNLFVHKKNDSELLSRSIGFPNTLGYGHINSTNLGFICSYGFMFNSFHSSISIFDSNAKITKNIIKTDTIINSYVEHDNREFIVATLPFKKDLETSSKWLEIFELKDREVFIPISKIDDSVIVVLDFFEKNGTFYLFIMDDDSSNYLIKTIDQGLSWVSISSTQFNSIRDFEYSNIGSNFIIITADKQQVFYSTNLGNTWSELITDLKDNSLITKVEISENYIFLMGGDTQIYKYRIDEITSVEEQNYVLNSSLHLSNPYPNPAKTEVKVQFYWDINLPMAIEDISIYDINGKKIDVSGNINLVKQENHYGNIIWDCSSAQPGIYLINIKHGTEEKAVKVVVE